ncbi:TetR family transcriptional regulator [Amycolatopsis sp. OK19-0408]|uniref:TetR family transcriptional regulator n=1 Tax=Amycolatopsis iheyensis TaxID=2945988 RepID=A0A9X2NDA3_9PSEU|nr:TetR family transcriptional regulator [Amycolatopsis iheyensis]MCR6482430.1 TetR family transcriptional regulator [Amycolatopsis iheyensis]
MTDDTRAKILDAALEEFSERGFHATSIRELAERVGVTKTAVLYHFPGKADIVTALAEPLLDDLEATMAKAAEAPDPRMAAIEGLVDVWLGHRYLLRMNLRDLGLTASTTVFTRFRDSMLKANVLVAGPDADLAGRVRAAQAIAMLSDPVVLFADAPADELRAAVLDGVDRLFGGPEPEVKSRGRRGRPTVMSPETIEAAQRLYEAGHAPSDIATALGVSRATIYRHLPGVE